MMHVLVLCLEAGSFKFRKHAKLVSQLLFLQAQYIDIVNWSYHLWTRYNIYDDQNSSGKSTDCVSITYRDGVMDTYCVQNATPCHVREHNLHFYKLQNIVLWYILIVYLITFDNNWTWDYLSHKLLKWSTVSAQNDLIFVSGAQPWMSW